MKFPSIWKITVLILSQAALAPAMGAPSGSGYTVRSGDTFAKIARLEGISLGALLKVNKVSDPNLIYLGQRIVLPGAAPAKEVTQTSPKSAAKPTKTTVANSPTTAQPSSPKKPEKTTRSGNTTVDITPPTGQGLHTVQAGDTLSRIASLTGASPAQIMALNGLSEDSKLRVGQTLRTKTAAAKPPVKKVPAIEQPAGLDEAPVNTQNRSGVKPAAHITTLSHKVKSGESFASLSRSYGISSSRLGAANRGVDPSRLRIGQTILIPGQPAREQAKPLTVRADGRVLADHRDPLDPAYVSETPPPVTERTRTGYQVEDGDKLAGIAQRYNTTTEYLRALNRMGASEDVYPGRYILVPFIPQNPGEPADTSRRQDI